jgi:hypothetical protein
MDVWVIMQPAYLDRVVTFFRDGLDFGFCNSWWLQCQQRLKQCLDLHNCGHDYVRNTEADSTGQQRKIGGRLQQENSA